MRSVCIVEVHVTVSIIIPSFNISGLHIVVLFNRSEEKVHMPSNTTK
jgi:hypothetical protein